MNATAPLEALLRETLDRLVRQEQRTAAIEAALLGAPADAQTPTPRGADTPIAIWNAPRRPDREPPPPPPAPLAAVVDSLDDVIWSVSPDGRLVFLAGGAVERLYGFTPHELQDRPGRWLDAVWPEDREKFAAALARLTDTGAFQLEHRVLRSNQSVRWAVTRGKLVRDPEGRPLRVDGTTADVTRTARPRDAVLAVLKGCGPSTVADFLQKLTQNLCDAFEVRAAVVVEPGAAGEAGPAAGWLDGRPAAPFSAPADAGVVRDLLAGASLLVPSRANERFPRDPFLVRFRAQAVAAEPLAGADGRVLGFLALIDDRPFPPDAEFSKALQALAPRAAVELARRTEPPPDNRPDPRLADAEERAAAAEAALRASAHLASAGRLAAGVAHDFHNLLGVIAGNADLLRERLPQTDPSREFAETISRTAHTVAAVSRQLVEVGKPTTSAPAPLDVANEIRSLEPMLRRLTGRRIPLALDLAPGVPLVRADATDFARVVLNLVLNARDASRPGDTVTVRATTSAIERGRVGWPPELPPGEYVTVTVADQGCGMSAEVRARMFELFFTTKGDGGTGLGLATVRDAVRAARGHIEVESDPGWGTTVRVYWPPL